MDGKDISRVQVQQWIDDYQALTKAERNEKTLDTYVREQVIATVGGDDALVVRANGEVPEAMHIADVISADLGSYRHAESGS
jgi:hypothetical protein